MNVRLVISIAVSAVLVGWALWSVSLSPQTESDTAVQATVEEGRQFIDISARGGYFPRVVVAKAGVPTTLRVTTKGTFDCSSSLVIPKLSYRKFLPASGTEDIEIPAEKAQGTIQGLCSMGMYNFQIRFE